MSHKPLVVISPNLHLGAAGDTDEILRSNKGQVQDHGVARYGQKALGKF